jgi:hypothetical protein
MLPDPNSHDEIFHCFSLECPEIREVQYYVGDDGDIFDLFDSSKPRVDTWFWSSFAKPIEGAERVQHFHPEGPRNGKLNILERLPTELIYEIIDVLLAIFDEDGYTKPAVLCLGLSSPVLYPKVLSHIHRAFNRSPARSWVGQRVGFQGRTRYPMRVIAKYKKADALLTTSYYSWKDGSRPEEDWHHALLYVEAHLAPNMPAEQLFAVRRDLSQMYKYPQDKPWVLRNLTTRQYMRSDTLVPPANVADKFILLPPPKSRLIDKIWRKIVPRKSTPEERLVKEHRKKARTEPLTLPQIFLLMVWHSTSCRYKHKFYISYGPWNAHTFDIVPLSHFQSEAEEWTDVTLPVVSDIGHLRWCIWRARAVYARHREVEYDNAWTDFGSRLEVSRKKWRKKLWEDLRLNEEGYRLEWGRDAEWGRDGPF